MPYKLSKLQVIWDSVGYNHDLGLTQPDRQCSGFRGPLRPLQDLVVCFRVIPKQSFWIRILLHIQSKSMNMKNNKLYVSVLINMIDKSQKYIEISQIQDLITLP